jgi:hypothetical protein
LTDASLASVKVRTVMAVYDGLPLFSTAVSFLGLYGTGSTMVPQPARGMVRHTRMILIIRLPFVALQAAVVVIISFRPPLGCTLSYRPLWVDGPSPMVDRIRSRIGSEM